MCITDDAAYGRVRLTAMAFDTPRSGLGPAGFGKVMLMKLNSSYYEHRNKIFGN
jgi:hypothetical protein